jgi:hypothetical protein
MYHLDSTIRVTKQNHQMDIVSIPRWLCIAEYRNKDNQAKYGKVKQMGLYQIF